MRPARGNGRFNANRGSKKKRLVLQAQAVEDTRSMFFDPIGPRFGLFCSGEVKQVTPLSARREGFEVALEVRFFGESVEQFLGPLHRIGSLLRRLESGALEFDGLGDQCHKGRSKCFDLGARGYLH